MSLGGDLMDRADRMETEALKYVGEIATTDPTEAWVELNRCKYCGVSWPMDLQDVSEGITPNKYMMKPNPHEDDCPFIRARMVLRLPVYNPELMRHE
jgi:hypothetical protein